MFQHIFLFLVCVLAVYGAYSLISCLADAIRIRSAAGSLRIRVIVAVRDAEEQIEYIVRNVVKADLASRLMSDGKVIFVDMDSQDGTFMLLEKLKKDYENMDVLKLDDRDKAFSPAQS